MQEKIYTKKAPEAIGPYSQAIKTEKFIYTSGQIAINPQTGEVEAKGIEEQTKQVMKNLEEVLKESGSEMGKIIKTTCFLLDMNDFAKFNEIYGEYITHKPARSCIEVRRLPKDVLVEVECIAIY